MSLKCIKFHHKMQYNVRTFIALAGYSRHEKNNNKKCNKYKKVTSHDACNCEQESDDS